jgi:hypothetical protein
MSFLLGFPFLIWDFGFYFNFSILFRFRVAVSGIMLLFVIIEVFEVTL